MKGDEKGVRRLSGKPDYADAWSLLDESNGDHIREMGELMAKTLNATLMEFGLHDFRFDASWYQSRDTQDFVDFGFDNYLQLRQQRASQGKKTHVINPVMARVAIQSLYNFREELRGPVGAAKFRRNVANVKKPTKSGKTKDIQLNAIITCVAVTIESGVKTRPLIILTCETDHETQLEKELKSSTFFLQFLSLSYKGSKPDPIRNHMREWKTFFGDDSGSGPIYVRRVASKKSEDYFYRCRQRSLAAKEHLAMFIDESDWAVQEGGVIDKWFSVDHDKTLAAIRGKGIDPRITGLYREIANKTPYVSIHYYSATMHGFEELEDHVHTTNAEVGVGYLWLQSVPRLTIPNAAKLLGIEDVEKLGETSQFKRHPFGNISSFQQVYYASPQTSSTLPATIPFSTFLTLKGKLKATAAVREDGIVVIQKGSGIRAATVPSTSAGAKAIRRSLHLNRLLSFKGNGSYYVLKQDLECPSLSLAASVCLGRNASGPKSWIAPPPPRLDTVVPSSENAEERWDWYREEFYPQKLAELFLAFMNANKPGKPTIGQGKPYAGITCRPFICNEAINLKLATRLRHYLGDQAVVIPYVSLSENFAEEQICWTAEGEPEDAINRAFSLLGLPIGSRPVLFLLSQKGRRGTLFEDNYVQLDFSAGYSNDTTLEQTAGRSPGFKENVLLCLTPHNDFLVGKFLKGESKLPASRHTTSHGGIARDTTLTIRPAEVAAVPEIAEWLRRIEDDILNRKWMIEICQYNHHYVERPRASGQKKCQNKGCKCSLTHDRRYIRNGETGFMKSYKSGEPQANFFGKGMFDREMVELIARNHHLIFRDSDTGEAKYQGVNLLWLDEADEFPEKTKMHRYMMVNGSWGGEDYKNFLRMTLGIREEDIPSSSIIEICEKEWHLVEKGNSEFTPRKIDPPLNPDELYGFVGLREFTGDNPEMKDNPNNRDREQVQVWWEYDFDAATKRWKMKVVAVRLRLKRPLITNRIHTPKEGTVPWKLAGPGDRKRMGLK